MTSTTEVEINLINPMVLSPSQPNSIFITVNTKDEEIFVDQSSVQETSRSSRFSPTFVVNNLSLHCSCHGCISSLLHYPFINCDWLSDALVPEISHAAMGFRYNSFTFTLDVLVTNRTKTFISVESNKEKSLRLVLRGRMESEELKSMKMETESCSICLDMFSGPKRYELTRMGCSHVFHTYCLLEWLERKNTCPLCRTVLYDQ